MFGKHLFIFPILLNNIHTHTPEAHALFGESAIFWLEESMRLHIPSGDVKSGVGN